MNYNYLTTRDCLNAIECGQDRSRQGLNDKVFMDKWLAFRQADQYKPDVFFRGLIGMHDVKPQQVFTQVHCVKLQAQGSNKQDKYILFIQATPPPSSGLVPANQGSPIAILDYTAAQDTPLWTRLTHTLHFRMNRGHAAQLFAALALTTNNLLEPGLSQRLVDWACYAAMGTSAATEVMPPETPRKGAAGSTPIPCRPVKSRRSGRQVQGVQPLPPFALLFQ
ncbi:hypothetical protein B0H16DRAFT_1551702 [Mycena metata]|uniref:Uncharacterized protein n=1 Tax=Mycena metata TaxID=1033252 RepID=A0AAD7IU43_9AGAR|nr:hypothetical protein B0H16DRAFT_1551702 [Mycena metata]